MVDVDDPGNDERLRRIEAVTDAALAKLDLEDLLDELLDRVRDLLNVDTAVILLLDPESQQLVATAAKGIEEEVRQGFRLAVGQGFAGRIAKDGQPVVVEHVTRSVVVNPMLHKKGIRSLLGVPMIAGGEVVGVLHVGTMRPRHFTADDIKLLQLVADRASLASQARLSSIDRAAALALQRSLLPTRLPPIAGVEMAARYAPGHSTGVGGDWYDVFVLPEGRIGVVVGDVSGHGLAAAVVMGRLRSALRAYALEHADPSEVLTRLDRKIHHFESGNIATALYAIIEPGARHMQISLAGHLPPMLAVPTRPAAMLSLPVDLPLGTAGLPQRRSTQIELPVGGIVVCYTDGLVERRDEHIDLGLDRLRNAIEPASAETLCTTIMDKVAPDVPSDDVALLVIRRVLDVTSTS